MNKLVFDEKIIYSNEWVVMQNNILECFKSMNLDEKRMILIASTIARTINATEQDVIKFSVHEYAEECGIDVNNAYQQLEEASKNLLKRYFSFLNEKGNRVASNWVIDCVYEEASINIRFTKFVLIMLKELDKFNPYTKYKKSIALQLKQTYSIDLYHLLKKNQRLGVFNISIDELNQELGFPASYERMDNLKRFFLVPTIEEINEKTDILVSYENVKQGRKVVGFRFTVKTKTAVAQEVNDVLNTLPRKKKTKRNKGLSDKQIAKIAIYRNEFVERNKHIKVDGSDYATIFENFKPLLQSVETVNDFKEIDVFLSMKKGDSLPPASADDSNTATKKRGRPKKETKEKTHEPEIKQSGFDFETQETEPAKAEKLLLKGKTMSQSMMEILRNKLDDETIEQTYERIKVNY